MHARKEEGMLSPLSREDSVCNSPPSIKGLFETHCNYTAKERELRGKGTTYTMMTYDLTLKGKEDWMLKRWKEREKEERGPSFLFMLGKVSGKSEMWVRRGKK